MHSFRVRGLARDDSGHRQSGASGIERNSANQCESRCLESLCDSIVTSVRDCKKLCELPYTSPVHHRVASRMHDDSRVSIPIPDMHIEMICATRYMR